MTGVDGGSADLFVHGVNLAVISFKMERHLTN